MKQKVKTKEEYNDYVIEQGLPLFYQPWYLDAVCGPNNWDVVIAIRDKKVVGVWPYYKKKKNLLSTITQPILTSYLGPHIIDHNQTDKRSTQIGFEKKVLTELSNQLPQVSRVIVQGHPSWTNWQPLSWLGYEQTTRYTYRIDLTKSIDDLYRALSDKTRNQIKSIEKKVLIEEEEDINQIFELVAATYQRQAMSVPFSKQQLDKLHRELNNHSSYKAYTALYDDEKAAVVYNSFDSETMYLLITGQSDKKISGSVSALIWKSIVVAKELGCKVFDFEGSMIEGVESFFRSFGGEQVAYHRISKASNRSLYVLFKLFGKL